MSYCNLPSVEFFHSVLRFLKFNNRTSLRTESLASVIHSFYYSVVY